MYLKIYFPQETITTSIITSDFVYTQVYYNDLQPAENSARFTILFNQNIANKLKQNINNNVKVEIKNADETNYFSGYLKKNVSFSKASRNGNISLEVVSPSCLLNEQFKEEYWATEISLNNAVEYILEYCGISDYNLSNLPSVVLPVFHAEKDADIQSELRELLFEYGVVYDFNNDGVFICNPLFNQPPETITQVFADGKRGNILGLVSQSVQERKFDGVSAEYRRLINKSNQLIFSDTSDHVVTSGGNLYDNESGTYTEYDSTVGKPFYIQSIDSWKVGTGSEVITNRNPETSKLKGTFENYGSRGLLIVKNKLLVDQTINLVEIKGSGYFYPEEAEKAVTQDGKKLDEIILDYVFTKERALALAESLSNYYKYSNFKLTLHSYDEYTYGSFVSVSIGGMGTIKGRIVQKKRTLQSNLIEYTIDAIDEFEEATIDIETTASSNSTGAITQEVVKQIEPQIEGIVAPVVSQSIVTLSPRYRGKVETLPDVDIPPYNLGDWVFLSVAEMDGEEVLREIGLYKKSKDSVTGLYHWELIPYNSDGSTDTYYNAATSDLLVYYTSEDDNVGAYARAYINHLFVNKLVIGEGGSIQSSNYSEENGTGFLIDSNGDIKANRGYFRGQVATDENLGYFVPSSDGRYIKTITIRNTNSEKKMYNYKVYIYAPNNIQSNNERSLLLADLIVNFSTQGQERKSAIISGIIYDNNASITTTYTADKYCTITFNGRAGDSLYLSKILLKG